MKTHLQTSFLGKKTNYIFMWLSLLLLLANSAKAQYVPSYLFSSSIGTYVPLTTGTVLGSGTVDDDSYSGMNIGFPFVYDGITYTTFSVNANGLIRMGSSATSSYSFVDDQVQNAFAAINEDLQGSSTGVISYDTIGTAPNRVLVVQWANWAFYPTTSDTMNFQIRLHETSNVIEFAYGNFYKVNDDYVAVGITGNPGSQFNSRTTDTDWDATTASSASYDVCFLSATGPVLPANGLKYTFSPPPMVYNTSIVEAGPALGVAPGGVNQVVGSLKVTVEGIGSYLPASAITVNTTGTTNLADISNLRVFYTGSSSSFSAATQFGSDVSSPGASSVITDSINLFTGDNYFWVTYDIAGAAPLGNVVDAAISDVTIGNVLRTPTVTSPAGNRQISSPMTFVSATADNAKLTSMGQGTANNEILKMMVITSSSGSSADVTQFDLSALGTTDTADIKNLKIWYTGNSNVFSATTQFGSTLTNLPGTITYTITGAQSLFNDTNYFWLTADITPTATITNVVDAEWNGVIVGGNPEIPAITSPIGNRAIRADYCVALATNPNSCNWNYFISAVNTSGASGNLNNTSNCNGNPNNYIKTNQTLTIKPTETITMTLGNYTSWITYAAWIDYNQDGVFDNLTEMILQGDQYNQGMVSGSFTVPCSALPGVTRMRIRGGDYYNTFNFISDACSDIGLGETEDYNVIVLPNPATYLESIALQQTGTTFPGATDRKVLKVPVTIEGCGVGVVSNFTFSTTGTTTASNITSAKLYRTGSSEIFSNSNLLGTVATPNGQFSFTIADTLIEDGTTNYWLA